MAKYVNTTVETTELIPKIKDRGSISNVSISNLVTTDQAEVDLYLDNGAEQFYIVSRVKIPIGATLLLDSNLAFDSSIYSLNIKNYASNKSLTIKIN